MNAGNRWQKRVNAADWDAVATELDTLGGALLPQLLTPAETIKIRGMYDDAERFRSTVDMARHRFGEGQYRYFREPYPEPIAALKQALYPRLLPIARDWAARLGRPGTWPDTLDEWLDQCHAAGQTKSTAILLRYRENDWNALHQDLYGDLIFPLQVVINLNEPGVDHTGGEFMLVEQRPRAVTRDVVHHPLRTRTGIHHPGTAGSLGAGLVCRPDPARRVARALGRAAHAWPGVPRRTLTGSAHHPVTISNYSYLRLN